MVAILAESVGGSQSEYVFAQMGLYRYYQSNYGKLTNLNTGKNYGNISMARG